MDSANEKKARPTREPAPTSRGAVNAESPPAPAKDGGVVKTEEPMERDPHHPLRTLQLGPIPDRRLWITVRVDDVTVTLPLLPGAWTDEQVRVQALRAARDVIDKLLR